MILDAFASYASLLEIPALAQAAEAQGFDCLWLDETVHDPFLPAGLIAEHTTRLRFGTQVAIAFARSPAVLAYTAWDLARASGGRFILGLGTQVKAHIQRRFGMPWPESVTGQLREYLAALRAFWRAWQDGEKLNFRGEYYKLTLMTPFFNPGPVDHPEIPIYLAGVNTGLARLAGEAADGFLVHPLHSPRYLREILLPSIQQGAAGAGRSSAGVTISVTAFVVTTPEEERLTRRRIAFYASTPSYRAVLTLHGWEAVAEQLSGLAARGRWEDMPALVDDEMLSTFAVIASPLDLAHQLRQRYAGLADRLSISSSFRPGQRQAFWRELVDNLTSFPTCGSISPTIV